MKLSAPWIRFVNEVKELFKRDDKIRIEYDDDEKVIRLFVEGERKAQALYALLPEEKTFGEVVVHIEVIPANGGETAFVENLRAAFDGNPALVEVQSVDSPLGQFSYVVFEKRVVQFYDDDLGDPHGNRSTLYQDIAGDVLDQWGPGVFYCTDTKDPEDLNGEG